jgi:archaellum biogenesis ATPase FlaH
MQKGNYRTYRGEAIIAINESKAQPIIDGLLYENDLIMIVGKSKVNKSIFAMQMACSISSGTKFLKTFDVVRPRRVWYFATEGKDEDIKDRFRRMVKVVPANLDNILLNCSPGFRFNTGQGLHKLKSVYNENEDLIPSVIIIDALYKSIKGSMKDDNNITDFLHVVGEFADKCDASVILVHHKTKTIYNDGMALDRGDEDTYGSSFLLNAVDHCINIKGNPREKVRDVSIDTQRSGNIIDRLVVELVEPDPLYLKLISTGEDATGHIYELIQKKPEGMTIKDLMDATEFGRTKCYETLSALQESGLVLKTDTRPVYYKKKPNYLEKIS